MVDRPNRPERPGRDDIRRGRTIARMREDGQELVTEERLWTMFLDLGITGDLKDLARRGMEILRG